MGWTVCGLVLFFVLLSHSHYIHNRYRSIADRLLKMRLEPLRRLVKRDVSYEFMNRQMVWHAFTVGQPQLVNLIDN
jgi:Pex2 / Pex12 amino terminal region